MSTPTLKALFANALECTCNTIVSTYGYVPTGTLSGLMPMSVRSKNATLTGIMFVSIKQTCSNPFLHDDDLLRYRFIREHVKSPNSAIFASFVYDCMVASNASHMDSLKAFFVAYAYDMVAMSGRDNEPQFMYDWLEGNRIFSRLQLERVLNEMRLAMCKEAA